MSADASLARPVRRSHSPAHECQSINQAVGPTRLVEQFTQIVKETQLRGDQLKLEITESMMMENIAEVQPILLRLKQLGIQLVLMILGLDIRL